MPAIEKHFDQLMHVIALNVHNVTGIVQSFEIDLELPKGYVAKPKKIILELTSIPAVTAGVAMEDDEIQCALIRDPDDITTIEIPDNSIQHDVIADAIFCSAWLWLAASVGLYVFNHTIKILDFYEDAFDIVSARNMRFNVIGTAAVNFDVKMTMYYTLESISKDEVLELLDIL